LGGIVPGQTAYAFTESDRAEFNRIRRKVDGIRGAGIKNAHTDISFAPPPTQRRVAAEAPDNFYRVRCVVDGGTAGNALTGTPSNYTYTIYDDDTDDVLARELPWYTERLFATASTPGGYGLAFMVDSNDKVGVGGSYGAPPTTGSGGSSTLQPWRLWSCDEQYTLQPCAGDSSSGSSSGS
jgi:hypothetical protein